MFARSATMGNARASMRGTGDDDGLTFFFDLLVSLIETLRHK